MKHTRIITFGFGKLSNKQLAVCKICKKEFKIGEKILSKNSRPTRKRYCLKCAKQVNII